MDDNGGSAAAIILVLVVLLVLVLLLLWLSGVFERQPAEEIRSFLALLHTV